MEQQELSYQMFKSKIIFIILLVVVSCSMTNGFANREKVKKQISNLFFEPDTTINNKLILRDENSVNIFFKGDIDLIPESKELVFPAVYFSNKSRTQYIAAYHYHGDLKNQFSLFEVGYYNELSSGIKLIQTEYDFFMTENKILLGMTKEEIIERKGNEFILIKSEVSESLRYVLSDYPNSPFLKRYNLPVYFAEYNFENDRLVKFSFGFEYP